MKKVGQVDLSFITRDWLYCRSNESTDVVIILTKLVILLPIMHSFLYCYQVKVYVMEIAKEELAQIKDILRKNPRGMNVSEIADAIGVRRSTAARYLDMLVLTGHLDLKEIGPSKVYYSSQRMPLSAMLSLSSDFIIVLDKNLNIINVNDRFLEFSNMSRDDVIYKNIQLFAIPAKFKPSFMPLIGKALEGTESTTEATFEQKGETHYYNIKLIPIVFDEGDKGVTILVEDITDRKQIEQVIRDSEEKFRSVIEQSLDGIMLIDNSGTIIEFSQGVEFITGMNSKANIGKKLWETEFVPFIWGEYNSDYRTEAGINNLKIFILEYLKTGISPLGTNSFEMSFIRPDKEKRVVLLNYSIIRSKKGNMICIIARDITERKIAEEALRERESWLKKILDMSPVPMVVSDGKSQKPIYQNAKFTEIFGYTIEEIPSAHEWFLLAYPDAEYRNFILKNWAKDMELLYKERVCVTTKESKVRCKDGSTRIIVLSISWMGDQNIMVFYDITERKLAEEGLRRAGETYLSMLELVNDGVWEVDRDLVVTYVNSQICEKLGLQRDDIVGKTPMVIMPPGMAEFFSKAVMPILAMRKPFKRAVFKFMSGNGHEIIAEVSGTPIFDENGEYQGYRGVARDVTGRQKAELKSEDLS